MDLQGSARTPTFVTDKGRDDRGWGDDRSNRYKQLVRYWYRTGNLSKWKD